MQTEKLHTSRLNINVFSILFQVKDHASQKKKKERKKKVMCLEKGTQEDFQHIISKELKMKRQTFLSKANTL